jgi:hypothetical protein
MARAYMTKKALLKSVSRKMETRVRELWEAFSAESTRGMILILTAEIDNKLLEALKLFLKDGRNKEDDNLLFGSFGPFHGFALRIEMAYRLGLISKPDADALDLLRRIRNSCAHATTAFSLEKEPHRSRLLEFTKLTYGQNPEYGFMVFGAICPKTEQEHVYYMFMSHWVQLEFTMAKLKKTPDRFYKKPIPRVAAR